MTSESTLIERQMAEVELCLFTIDDFHHRRHQKQRNRRIATGVMGLVLLAAAAGGVLQTLGNDDERVDSDVLGPLPSPFVGTWESTDADGSSQTMEIVRTDGDEHDVVLRDESASPCAGGVSTEAGSGQVRATELVVRLVLTCADGSEPVQGAATLTFTHDPETDELIDSIGVVWRREGAPPDDDAGPILPGPSPFVGTWVVGREGQYFPDSLEIRLVGDGDLHEAVSLKAETPQCAGGPSTMSGTGRREVDQGQNPGLVYLAVTVTLTCDDGTTPIPQSSSEDAILGEFGISYTHDPVTDELKGSLGSLFIREGAELAQGDPMGTIERMVGALNARDVDAYIDLFAPDGRFDSRGTFGASSMFLDRQPISDAPRVRAWMAVQDAWDHEAEVISCTSDPAEPVDQDPESSAWIECEVAARWPKLSLEITDRWRFALRGARLVYWEPVPLDLDPPERALRLGYPGLEAWEAWLEANRPEDAERWLVRREEPTAAEFAGAEDPEREAALARLTFPTQRSWVIDGHRFSPAGLIPYDPAFADEIEASINDYVEEQ